jgi:hypothetical protein
MKYLRWIHIEDYAIKYEAYIEDESAGKASGNIRLEETNDNLIRWTHSPESASGSII